MENSGGSGAHISGNCCNMGHADAMCSDRISAGGNSGSDCDADWHGKCGMVFVRVWRDVWRHISADFEMLQGGDWIWR